MFFFWGREPTLKQLMQLVLGLVGMHFEKGPKKVKNHPIRVTVHPSTLKRYDSFWETGLLLFGLSVSEK